MSISKHDDDKNHFEYRDLYSGLIRLHILHHAVEEPIFGLEMAEELAIRLQLVEQWQRLAHTQERWQQDRDGADECPREH